MNPIIKEIYRCYLVENYKSFRDLFVGSYILTGTGCGIGEAKGILDLGLFVKSSDIHYQDMSIQEFIEQLKQGKWNN